MSTPDRPTNNISILTELPAEVIEFIAKSCAPYTLLALSSTCRTLRPLWFDKTLWLNVSDVVSQSRPLPFSAAQAQSDAVSVHDLRRSCLRAQRVARRWAASEVYPNPKLPVKIAFPDCRMLSYFTFLPGLRHVMLHDSHNVLSCWTTEGVLLKTWHLALGAQLTRWKPCDESENCYDYVPGMQAVEIMVDSARLPTRCDIILLIYSETSATFSPMNGFRIPSVFEPFSAMTQDELRGALVALPNPIPPSADRVGIYLTDKHTQKAICIDTGLVPRYIPQALLSARHVVLYWETKHGAHSFAYDLDALREILAREGVAQNDPALVNPVPAPPSETRVVPFETGLGPALAQFKASAIPNSNSAGAIDVGTDMSANWDWYPVIIPKWPTLREDLRRHRTRSVLTFSRRPRWRAEEEEEGNDAGDFELEEIGMGMIDGMEGLEGLEVINGIVFTHDPGVAGWNQGVMLPGPLTMHNEVGVPIMEGAPQDGTGEEGPEPFVFPFSDDEVPVPFAVPQQESQDLGHIAPDVLHADPQNLPNLPHVQRLYPGRSAIIAHHYFDYSALAAASDPPPVLRRTVMAEVTLRRPNEVRLRRRMPPVHGNAIINFDAQGNAVVVNHNPNLNPNGNENDNVDGGGNAGANGANDMDDDWNNVFWDWDELDGPDAFVQDAFGGSPVMGYGGRCATWVEEVLKNCGSVYERHNLIRLATFPRPECSNFALDGTDLGKDGIERYAELEEGLGNVATLHLPECINLEESYAFDLDDVRGLLGVATEKGELWLIDYS